nr:uncharacterized protein LOC129471220 [Symphalangus syndactylus]
MVLQSAQEASASGEGLRKLSILKLHVAGEGGAGFGVLSKRPSGWLNTRKETFTGDISLQARKRKSPAWTERVLSSKRGRRDLCCLDDASSAASSSWVCIRHDIFSTIAEIISTLSPAPQLPSYLDNESSRTCLLMDLATSNCLPVMMAKLSAHRDNCALSLLHCLFLLLEDESRTCRQMIKYSTASAAESNKNLFSREFMVSAIGSHCCTGIYSY